MTYHVTPLFDLTEEEAIAILQTPLNPSIDHGDRYLAASYLAFFPSEASIQTLIATVENVDDQLADRITRRKAVESLGRLKAVESLPILSKCLEDEDNYIVENAVFAIGEITTENQEILAKITNLLDKSHYNHRKIIQTLTKLNYQSAIKKIKPLTTSSEEAIASAAIASLASLTGDFSQVRKITTFLHHAKAKDRRDCIQDLINSEYYEGIEAIAQCPVSMVFRLRAIRLMGKSGLQKNKLNFEEVKIYLENILEDHIKNLKFVYKYNQIPDLEFLINELYDSDFERAYLATQYILKLYSKQAPELLIKSYQEKAYNNYNAHYHFIKLFGWLRYKPSFDLLINNALQNKSPQFHTSRIAGAIALGELEEKSAIAELKKAIETNLWDLKYACLIALEKLGDSLSKDINKETIFLKK
jgi:bilin biosynthesis protein